MCPILCPKLLKNIVSYFRAVNAIYEINQLKGSYDVISSVLSHWTVTR